MKKPVEVTPAGTLWSLDDVPNGVWIAIIAVCTGVLMASSAIGALFIGHKLLDAGFNEFATSMAAAFSGVVVVVGLLVAGLALGQWVTDRT